MDNNLEQVNLFLLFKPIKKRYKRFLFLFIPLFLFSLILYQKNYITYKLNLNLVEKKEAKDLIPLYSKFHETIYRNGYLNSNLKEYLVSFFSENNSQIYRLTLVNDKYINRKSIRVNLLSDDLEAISNINENIFKHLKIIRDDFYDNQFLEKSLAVKLVKERYQEQYNNLQEYIFRNNISLKDKRKNILPFGNTVLYNFKDINFKPITYNKFSQLEINERFKNNLGKINSNKINSSFVIYLNYKTNAQKLIDLEKLYLALEEKFNDFQNELNISKSFDNAYNINTEIEEYDSSKILFFISTFLSFLISLTYLFFDISRNYIIRDFKLLKKLINFNFIDFIDIKKDNQLNKSNLDYFNNYSSKENIFIKTGVFLSDKSQKDNKFLQDFIKLLFNDRQYIISNDLFELYGCRNLIFILSKNTLTYNEINKINSSLNEFPGDVIGWFIFK